MNDTLYTTADEAYDAGQKWIEESDRHEKFDFLMETASPEFKDNVLTEMINWMGEDDFTEFFKHIKRHWNILTPQELAYVMEH